VIAEPSFQRHGPEAPASPVVLSVPHAGRDYPAALRAALRVPVDALRILEDRHVDALALAARGDETLFVAERARAWIDLNRDERERDPRLDDGVSAATMPMQSAKLRSGLGLVPRRAGAAGDIWSRRLSNAEVMARIERDHRPYHEAVAAALQAARARFGIAVLLDLHSMPPLGAPEEAPRIVFGDRFGRAAAARFLGRLDGVARAYCVQAATNAPYAGGYVLERHAAPRAGIHAIQIELDRSLYLDDRLDGLGEGFDTVTRLVRAMIDAVLDEAMPGAMAAE
jgi:N-formylglutamate amidohydrolase